MVLTAWRGQEATAVELIETVVQEAAVGGLGRLVNAGDYACSVLHNGLGRHDAARDAARRAFDRDLAGFGPLVVPELAEAAARTGDRGLVRAALEWLVKRTRVTPTDWALGIEAQVRALLSEGVDAESHYRESIERLSRSRARAQLARTHLLYGDWLRANAVLVKRAISCGLHTRCYRRWASVRSPSGPAGSWPPPARSPGSALSSAPCS